MHFVGRLEIDGDHAAEVNLDVPIAEPGETVGVPLPAELTAADARRESWLTVLAGLIDSQPWAPAGHVLARGQFDLTPIATPPRPPRVGAAGRLVADGAVELGPATFDGRTGGLQRLYGVEVSGPRFELWRGPTDNDRSAMRGSFELGSPEDTGGEGIPGPSSEQRWRERGLDRLVTRVASVMAGPDVLTVRTRSGAASIGLFVDVDYQWRLLDETLDLTVAITPSLGWDCTWPRVGIRFDLPVAIDQARWFGTGPLESYPDSSAAALVGQFAVGIDELNVRYSRPQETGHRPDLRWLVLSDADGPRLRLVTRPGTSGHRPGFTFTRHTPQELDRARHPHELGGPAASYLFLDDAVHGLGSRACGIDVLPRHALWPGARSFSVVFKDPGAE